MLLYVSRVYRISDSQITLGTIMSKAKKKPLLVSFIEIEHDFISLAAQSKGISRTAYIRLLVVKQLVKEGYDIKTLA